MIKVLYQDLEIRVYTDPMEFARMPEEPFGPILDEWEFAGIGETGDSKTTGFIDLDINVIYLCVLPDCTYRELLETVSHELGHKIEGGFKKNPPHHRRYDSKHEQKANHYQDFVISCYDLTELIIAELMKENILVFSK